MKRRFFRYIFLFFAIAAAAVSNSNGQDNSCNLQLKISEFNLSKQNIPVENVDLVLKNLKTGKKKSFTSLPSVSDFEDLSSGKYKVEIKAEDYKRRVKEFFVDCSFADENKVFFENINLWKDNSKNTDKINLPDSSAQKEVVTKEELSNIEENKKPKDISSKNSHKVEVEITIDEDGNVISAKAVGDETSFAEKAVKAARRAKFMPTILGGIPVKITGTIIYNFVQ